MTQPNFRPTFEKLADDVEWTWQEYDASRWAQHIDWLSVGERETLNTFKSEKRRLEFVLGRAAARRLVAEHLDILPQDVVLRVAGDGAVEIDSVELNLSISHADGWATATVSSRPVGIDMERVAMRQPGVYRYFLSPGEYPLLEGNDLDHDRLQILLWTLKEAVLKGRRTGLRVSPRRIVIVSLEQDGTAHIDDQEGGIWKLSWIFWRGCYLAIADKENLQ